ncbi:MAG: hypothetical protein ACU843_12710 [Gammaproteobacteria bacterium]
MKKHEGDLNDWLTIRFIAERSRTIGGFIYYPFMILFLMIIARSNTFDRYDFPVTLVILVGINFTLVTCCAIMLRISAEKARKAGLDGLNRRLFTALAESNELRAKQIQLLLDEVKDTREGVFSPITEQPVVRSLLLPFGGVGSVMLLDYLVAAYL